MTQRKPAGLGPAGTRFWLSVHRVYELAPAELLLLERAARITDLLAAIDVELSAGVTAEGSMGQVRSHPLLASAADLSRVLSNLVRDLALPLPGEDFGRVRSPQQRAAAQARWAKRDVGV